jgi:ATP-dependent DNA ligase
MPALFSRRVVSPQHGRACKLDLEGIMSKRRDLPYKPGPCRPWVKVRNPDYDRG